MLNAVAMRTPSFSRRSRKAAHLVVTNLGPERIVQYGKADRNAAGTFCELGSGSISPVFG
jgi:hypothetical protein